MKEIDSLTDFVTWIANPPLTPAAIQSLDLRAFEIKILAHSFPDCIFFGCHLSNVAAGHIVTHGGFVIPRNPSYVFDIHRSHLYSPAELFDGFDVADEKGYYKTFDYQVYQQYLDQGKDKPPSIQTSLMRRLHDHSITDALHELIEGQKVVAVMGGHGMERRDPFYAKIALLSRELTQRGFLMVSGGGPGAMEATHLGAYFAARSEKELLDAIAEMQVRPPKAEDGKEYNDRDWLHRAWRITDKYPIPEGQEPACMSIGIPTWLYGHEPPAPFATHIAKYFANSVREEGLLAIATYGVIFAPGSAGTIQEIFQDATQNHYGSMGHISPMILFGKTYWTVEKPLWNFLQSVSKDQRYRELLFLLDDKQEIIERIVEYDPEEYRT